MPNPFFNGQAYTGPTQNNNATSTNLKDIYNLLRNSNNPMRVFNNIAKNNPQMAPVLDLLQKGMSPEQIFNAMCQQRGINPQEFIKSIKG